MRALTEAKRTTVQCELDQPHLMFLDIVPKMSHIDVLNQEEEIYRLLEVHRKHFRYLSEEVYKIKNYTGAFLKFHDMVSLILIIYITCCLLLYT